MNLETKLDPRLWQFIQNSYENRNFTAAIIDALHFLSDLIREKSGLESDGAALIGNAFGGRSPKLKVNKLQSDSDWNVQKGIEQILRGIYQSIRNPRSHRRYNDKPEDADAIILFTNYLMGIIDQAKTPFSKDLFINSVFDPDFAENERYAELLVKKIPPKQRIEIFIDVYRAKEEADRDKLRYFIHALLKKLTKEEMSQVYEIVSEELEHTNDEGTIRSILTIFPSSCWKHYEEIGRLRIENKLIESIRSGRYQEEPKKFLSGALGTWATDIFEHFLLKEELMNALYHKLGWGERLEKDYVFNYFFYDMIEEEPKQRMINILVKGLKDGNKSYYEKVKYLIEFRGEPWKEALKESFDNFAEFEPTPDIPEDDIPF